MPIKSENYFLIRQHFFKLLGRHCAYCGGTEKLELDHILPNEKHRHDSGTSERIWEWFYAYDAGNLQILCAKCNKEKGSKYKYK